MIDREKKARQLLRHEENVLQVRRNVIAEQIARLREDRDLIDAVLDAMEHGEIDVEELVADLERDQ